MLDLLKGQLRVLFEVVKVDGRLWLSDHQGSVKAVVREPTEQDLRDYVRDGDMFPVGGYMSFIACDIEATFASGQVARIARIDVTPSGVEVLEDGLSPEAAAATTSTIQRHCPTSTRPRRR